MAVLSSCALVSRSRPAHEHCASASARQRGGGRALPGRGRPHRSDDFDDMALGIADYRGTDVVFRTILSGPQNLAPGFTHRCEDAIHIRDSEGEPGFTRVNGLVRGRELKEARQDEQVSACIARC